MPILGELNPPLYLKAPRLPSSGTITSPLDPTEPVSATLLTRQWFDVGGKLILQFWVRLEEGVGRILIDSEEAVFFVHRHIETKGGIRRSVDLQAMNSRPVDAVYFPTQQALIKERERLVHQQNYLPLEADIWPSDRFLMERFITGSLLIQGPATTKKHHQGGTFLEWYNPRLTASKTTCPLTLLSFDIETDDLFGPILSIAAVCGNESVVFVNRPDLTSPHFRSCDGEANVIAAFQDWLLARDPDILTGWNVIGYDLRCLLERSRHLGINLRLGRGRGKTSVRSTQRRGGMIADIEGRVVLDGRQTLQASGYYAERYSLEYTSQHLLQEGKTLKKVDDKAAEILRLYHEAPDELAIYNLKDCQLVTQIFEKQDLLGFVLERQELTGLSLERFGGSVAAFDHTYLPRLHRRGRVARSVDNNATGADSPGGFVMDSVPGLFRNVLVLDFKSLYPSIIRTFKVDPYALVTALDLIKSSPDKPPPATLIKGFRGAYFHSTEHILPALIEELWSARDDAKARGDKARSTAIKILMNSFYGVLGTTGCRFFDNRLASSITMRGHQILQDTRQFIEAAGYTVIYGDTDSVFVHVGNDLSPDVAHQVGKDLAQKINAHWATWCEHHHGIPSHLEIEFETHYLRFYLPTKRNSDEGSKKRYAGLILNKENQPEVIVKGMEAARTDWTPLAREFQLELFRRIFLDDLQDLGKWVQSIVHDVRQGRLDHKLVYSKKLRRHPDDYTNTPPHVAAAKLLSTPPRRVSYVITLAGPQPISLITAPLDHQHYLDTQLLPAAEAILQEIGLDFERLTSRQTYLF